MKERWPRLRGQKTYLYFFARTRSIGRVGSVRDGELAILLQLARGALEAAGGRVKEAGLCFSQTGELLTRLSGPAPPRLYVQVVVCRTSSRRESDLGQVGRDHALE